MRRALLLLSLLLAAGCAHPAALLTQRKQETLEAGPVEVAFDADQESEHQRLVRSLEKASAQLKRWGKLEHPVTIFLLRSHADLETEARRHYGWLRAWARYDDIWFQTPSTWGPGGAKDAELDELVLHELTHCLMFQRSATKDTWLDRKIPLWFREGMATWTANQGYKWLSLEDLARFWEQHPDADPLGDPDSMVEHDNGVVYGAAHHCFTWLIKTHGEENVHRVLDAMRAGKDFNAAFAAVNAVAAEQFLGDFQRYVVGRGFRAPHDSAPGTPVPAAP